LSGLARCVLHHADAADGLIKFSAEKGQGHLKTHLEKVHGIELVDSAEIARRKVARKAKKKDAAAVGTGSIVKYAIAGGSRSDVSIQDVSRVV
jgi:hypothetical protein